MFTCAVHAEPRPPMHLWPIRVVRKTRAAYFTLSLLTDLWVALAFQCTPSRVKGRFHGEEYDACSCGPLTGQSTYALPLLYTIITIIITTTTTVYYYCIILSPLLYTIITSLLLSDSLLKYSSRCMLSFILHPATCALRLNFCLCSGVPNLKLNY